METRLLIDSLPRPQSYYGESRQVYCAPRARKAYWLFQDNEYLHETDSVFAVSTGTDSIVAKFTLLWMAYGACDDRTGDYAYFASASGYLIAVDTRTDSIVSGVHIPLCAQFLVPNRSTNRLYAVGGNDSVIQVVYDSVIFAGVRAASGNPAQLVRLQTVLRRDAPLRSTTAAALFDATGRRIAVLKNGLNDISRLLPGIYFWREGSGAGCKPRAVQKIVVAR